jgi:uncharacterized membrane protein
LSDAVLAFLRAQGIAPELAVFLISFLPVLELRGGLVAAAVMRIPIIKAFAVCFAGNILPVPFILCLIKKIFGVMKSRGVCRGLVTRLERAAERKGKSIREKQLIGLFFFVGLPLPGTGAWTGSLIAALLDIPARRAFPVIAAGVAMAGLIMITLTYFAPGLFGF